MARRTLKAAAAFPAPPAIPEPHQTAAERAREQTLRAETVRLIQEIGDMLKQQDLDRAVVLAKMAARRQGPLVEFFEEVGRKYRKLADEGPVIEGSQKLHLIDGRAG